MAQTPALISSDAALILCTTKRFSRITVSDDCTTVQLEQSLPPIVNSGVSLTLSKSNHEEVAHVIFPAKFENGKVSVRIDSYFSLIFKEHDKISNVDAEIVSKWDVWNALPKYTLTFHLRKSTTFVTSSLLSMIYTDHLKVDSTLIAVSAELLGIHSDFFTSLFYGPYLERTHNVKEIGEVSEVEFVEYISWIHRCNEPLATANAAVEAIYFADRFMMWHATRRALSQLRKLHCPVEHLEYALMLADKVSATPDIMTWILSQFPTRSVLSKTVHDALPNISTTTAQICIKALESYDLNKKTDYALMKKLIPTDYEQAIIGVHLLFYDLAGLFIEREDVETVDLLNRHDRRSGISTNYDWNYGIRERVPEELYVDMRALWNLIPGKYSTLTLGGTDGSISRRRDEGNVKFTGSHGDVVPCRVFMN